MYVNTWKNNFDFFTLLNNIPQFIISSPICPIYFNLLFKVSHLNTLPYNSKYETQSSLPAAFPFGGLKSVTSRNQTHTIIYKDIKSTYLYATLIFFLLSGSYLSGQAQRVAPSPPRWPAGDSTTPSLGSPSSSPPSISSPTVTRSSQCLALRSHPFSCTKPATNLMG